MNELVIGAFCLAVIFFFNFWSKRNSINVYIVALFVKTLRNFLVASPKDWAGCAPFTSVMLRRWNARGGPRQHTPMGHAHHCSNPLLRCVACIHIFHGWHGNCLSVLRANLSSNHPSERPTSAAWLGQVRSTPNLLTDCSFYKEAEFRKFKPIMMKKEIFQLPNHTKKNVLSWGEADLIF